MIKTPMTLRALRIAALMAVGFADALYSFDPSTVACVVATRHLLSTVEVEMERRK